MRDEQHFIMTKLIPFLKSKKQAYEEKGMVPTIDLLIQELEEKVSENL